MTGERWMVVDRHRTPVVTCTGMHRQANAQDEADTLNADPRGEEFGPYRVVRDTVAEDIG